ncbi:pilin [Patescibacteria group bacterium]
MKTFKKNLTIVLSFVLLISALIAPEALAAALDNPLGTSDVRIVVGRVIQGILGLSGVIALLMFIYGGFQWLTSQGNDTKIKKGKDTLIWAVIGLVVIFTAYTLVRAVISAITTGNVT